MSENKLEIGMFGGGGVGKTCMTLRFLKGEFSEGYIPTIEDEFNKIIDVDGQSFTLVIVDTAGQDDFAEIRFSYYGRVAGFVFVFDISNPASIEELKDMYKDAKDSCQGEFYCVVAANKADLRNEEGHELVPQDTYKDIEAELHCKVFETSAKTGLNIDELYTSLVKQIVGQKKPDAKAEKDSSAPKGDGGSGGCCIIA